jgi:hypothetical protein
MAKRTVTVNDKMQKGYRYVCSEPIGRNFDPGPALGGKASPESGWHGPGIRGNGNGPFRWA